MRATASSGIPFAQPRVSTVREPQIHVGTITPTPSPFAAANRRPATPRAPRIASILPGTVPHTSNSGESLSVAFHRSSHGAAKSVGSTSPPSQTATTRTPPCLFER